MNQALQSVVVKLNDWTHIAILMLPNLAVALVVLVAFWAVARFGRNLIGSLVSRLAIGPEVGALLAGLVYAVVIIIGLAIALGVLQLERTVTSLLAGVGILGLTLGFALQDVVANLVSGMLIQLQHPFVTGDVIESNSYCGRVRRITLRATELTQLDGQVVIIPNRDVFNKPVINNSATRSRRVEFEIAVWHQGRLTQALTTVHDVVARIEGLERNRVIEVFVKEAGDEVCTLLVWFWLASPAQDDYLRARSAAIEHIREALPAARKWLMHSERRPA